MRPTRVTPAGSRKPRRRVEETFGLLLAGAVTAAAV
jgi:hypothetical protein